MFSNALLFEQLLEQHQEYIDEQNRQRQRQQQEQNECAQPTPAVSFGPNVEVVRVQKPDNSLGIAFRAPLGNHQGHVQPPSPQHAGPKPNSPRPPQRS